MSAVADKPGNTGWVWFTRLGYYLCASLLAYFIVFYANAARTNFTAAAQQRSLTAATDQIWKSLLEKFSLSLYDGASAQQAALTGLYRAADHSVQLALTWSYWFVALSASYILVTIWFKKSRFGMALDVTAICLAIGLLAPVLSITAYAEIPIVGRVIVKYQSHSILSTIEQLVVSKNYFVALAILTFSVLLPLIKLVSASICLSSTSERYRRMVHHVIRAIGKWSMADVFIVAILVAFFALNADQITDARIGIGLYFFAVYCIGSQFAVHRIVQTADVSP